MHLMHFAIIFWILTKLYMIYDIKKQMELIIVLSIGTPEK